MNRALTAVKDLVSFSAQFAKSSDFRAAVQRLRMRPTGPAVESDQFERELAASPDAAKAHGRLSGGALALSAATLSGSTPRRVNLVLSEFDPAKIFAGISTALDFAAALAEKQGAPLRLVVLTERFRDAERDRAVEFLRERWGGDAEVVSRRDIIGHAFGSDDTWVVTHWTTAHPATVAALAGVLNPSRVVYLVQDFEPGFAGWSTASSVARTTYDAGFHLVVNSTPLAAYLADVAGIPVDSDLVFAPQLAIDRLSGPAHEGTPSTVRVLFYGRPSKPRNLFELGVAAIDHASYVLGDDVSVEFVSAGEAHPPRQLTGGRTLTSVGTLSWDGYFEHLHGAHVMLSLQASPHPSHPPLEAAISGALAITNEFEGTRAGLHPRLTPVEADPIALGEAVAAAVTASRTTARGTFAPTSRSLGNDIGQVVDAIAGRLS